MGIFHENVYLPVGIFPIIDIMSRHTEYSIRDKVTGSRKGGFRFGYSQRGSDVPESVGDNATIAIEAPTPTPIFEELETSHAEEPVFDAAPAFVEPLPASSPSSDSDCPALRELLSKIANDPANREMISKYNLESYSQLQSQESFQIDEQSMPLAPSPTFNYPMPSNTSAEENVQVQDSIEVDKLMSAPDMVDGSANSAFGMSSAPASPAASVPVAEAETAEEAQLGAIDTATAPAHSGGAWWRQTGGIGSVSSDSHMLHNTSSLIEKVGGFVTNALRGGKAYKPATRRAISSASSSESDAESSEDEKPASKKRAEESESSDSDKKKSKKSADKSDKPKRAPTAWMAYMGDVRALVKGAKGANAVAIVTKFASDYKKKAEESGKTGDDMYKAAIEMLRKEWASGVAKKKLSDMADA